MEILHGLIGILYFKMLLFLRQRKSMKLKLPNWGSLCNPNLLLNSDFQSGIINQNGQTSYMKGNNDWVRYYTIDMWAIQRGIQLSVNNDSISVKCTNSSEPGYLMQYVDYVGKATFIIDVQSVTGSVSFNTSEGQYTRLTKGLNVIPFDFSGGWLNIRISEGATIIINYMKLEKGSYFTGMPPWNYANEVSKCHAKMIGLGSIQAGDVSIGSANFFNSEVWIVIPLTNYFVKKPTVYSIGTIKLILDGYDEATITNLSLVAFSNQSVTVKGTLSKSFASNNGKIGRVIMTSGSRIIFDGNNY